MANDINIIIGGDVRQLERVMDDAVRRVRSSMGTMSNSVRSFQNLLIGAFSLDKLKEGLDFATTFDDNLRQVQAAAKLTAEQFEVIKQKALELGAEPGQTPEMIAAGMADAARAGQDFNQILDSISGTAKLAAGSELDFSEATESSVDILAQFGLTSKETAGLTDVLIAGANSASVKVGQLAESFKFAGALSHVLGESVIDTEAALLVLANSGLKAEQGGTGLRGVWTQLIKHADTLQESFGVVVSKMENGQRVFRSLDEIIGDLSKSGIQADEIFKIFGKTAGPAAAILLQEGQEGLLKYEEQLKSAGGSGQEVAETLQSGLGGSIRTITSQFQNAVILLNDQFAPAIVFVADNIYLLNSAVLGGIGVINTMRSAYASMMSTGARVISYFATVSDAVGVTSGRAEQLRQVSSDFTYVAGQMGEKAGKAFSDMADSALGATKAQEKHKESVDLTALSYKKDVDEHDKRVEGIVNGAEEMSKAEIKAAKKREKALDDMYKTLDSHSDAYYEREADKMFVQADQFRELGGEEVEIQQHAYNRISELAEDAYKNGNTAAGAYLDSLKSGFTEATTYISKEHQELIDKFRELSGETIEVTDDTDWDAIKADVDDFKNKVDKSELKFKIDDQTDWLSIYNQIAEVEAQADEVDIQFDIAPNIDFDTTKSQVLDLEDSLNSSKLSFSVEDKTNWENSKKEAEETAKKIDKVSDAVDELDGKSAEVTIDADTSGVESAMQAATGSIGVAMGSVESLRSAIKLFNETPTLDPFGESRAKYQAQIEQLNSVKSAAADVSSYVNSLDFSIDPNGEISAKYKEQLGEILEDSTATAEDVAKVRIDAEKEVQKAREEAHKEFIAMQKDSLKEQKDNLSEQLSDAKENLAYMEEYQKAYYDYLLGDAKDYYDELKQQRDDAVEAAKQAAQEEYDQAEELLNKKLELAQRELDGNSAKLSALKKIYSESGAGGVEYYKLEQQSLAKQAQEFQKLNVNRRDIEAWLQDELTDLRNKAAEEGITGLEGYENQIISTYERTGNFSDETVKAEEKVASLQAQLEQLKEAGTDAFFDDASIAAQGFDSKLESAQGNIDALQKQIDALDGKNFDFAGKSTDYFANTISNAKNNVVNLENQMDSLDSKIKQLDNSYKQFNATASQPVNVGSNVSVNTSSNETSTKKSNAGREIIGTSTGYVYADTLEPVSYTGGGYTGNSPRSGGLDGEGGFFAILHPQETVVDHTVSSSGGNSEASEIFNKLLAAVNSIQSGNRIVIENITVDKKMTSEELDNLVEDLSRRSRRG